jgi:hypothetical protein
MKKTTTLLTLLLVSVLVNHAQAKKALQSFRHNTLHFTENKGQVTDQYLQSRSDIDYKLAAGNGLNIFVGAGKLEYQWAKQESSQPTLNCTAWMWN